MIEKVKNYLVNASNYFKQETNQKMMVRIRTGSTGVLRFLENLSTTIFAPAISLNIMSSTVTQRLIKINDLRDLKDIYGKLPSNLKIFFDSTLKFTTTSANDADVIKEYGKTRVLEKRKILLEDFVFFRSALWILEDEATGFMEWSQYSTPLRTRNVAKRWNRLFMTGRKLGTNQWQMLSITSMREGLKKIILEHCTAYFKTVTRHTGKY